MKRILLLLLLLTTVLYACPATAEEAPAADTETGELTLFDIRYYLRLGGFLRPVGSLSRDNVVLHPLFTPFNNEPEKMHSLAWFPFVEGSTEQYALRGLLLGDAIVAESHSMGANSLDSVDNIPMHGQMANKGTWPHTNSSIANLWLKDSPLWYHADIKNLAYFYVYKVFDKMTNEME